MKILELKKEAKAKLNGKWKLAVGINLIYLIITLVLTFILSTFENSVLTSNPSGLGFLACFVLALAIGIIDIPLAYGLTACMLKLSRNKEMEVIGVFDFIKVGFKNFKKAFFLSLSILARLCIPMIILLFAITLTFFAILAEELSSNVELISLISLIIGIGSFIYILYKTLSYTLSTYILIDNPESNSKEIIKKSCILMKGNKFKLICLIFSFIGWIFLGGVLSILVEYIVQKIGILDAQGASYVGSIVTYVTSLLLTPYITFSEISFYEDLAETPDASTSTETDATIE